MFKLTKDQKKVLARHAAEATEQQVDHANERAELMERHAAERDKAGIVSTGGGAHTAGVVPSGGQRTQPAPSPASRG